MLPLGLDTFAVSSGLGGLPRTKRLRVSLLMSSFEMAMPLVGLAIGHGLGHAIGGAADHVAAAALLALGIYLLVANEDDEATKVAGLASGSGVALFLLGVSISLDELAMGFTIGLLHLSIIAAALLIGAQAFIVAQIGLRLGARLGARAREAAERLAGLALLGLGILVLVEQLA